MPTLPVSYTSVTEVYDKVPDIGSITTLTSAQVFAFLGEAEALVNANVVRTYSLPFTSVPPLISALSRTIGVYFILSQRVFAPDRLATSPWPDRFKEVIDTLNAINSGTIVLVDSGGAIIGGRTDAAEVYSTTLNYRQTFHEGPWSLQVQDPDKIEDELDNRELDGIIERLK